jgi:cold shock CspA family protein
LHYSAIQKYGYKCLREGGRDRVDVIDGDEGRPQADNVRRWDQQRIADALHLA